MSLTGSATLLPSIIVRCAQSYSVIEEQRDVFESHRHHVFSVAYYMTADEREAETILSSTFVETFRQHPRPTVDQLDGSLMSQLRQRLSLEPVPAMEAGTADLGGKNVRRTDLEEALWQLPGRERLCFLLRDVEAYAPARIARLLDTTEKEVQRTVLSARLRIRRLLMEPRPADA